ncbi:hypothetical protein CJ010_21900 [Azoarcus sp. DD4]|uniref:EF-hand domain-containing protein n=1 Tax=Azoarcus sp. DD4 TaxID=2027405 RepID=UPI00112A3B61|nr:EF-hand domain-containing protein [Azoarcus sp. DD4]QDF98999.1 hypothetical protein CJ010_21900 [Azoarcus sp. DD4]
MTSAISSSTSSYTSWATTTTTARRPDSSRLSEDLFSALDTSSKGYLEQADFESAFSSLSIDDSDAASAEEVFKALDADSDGKLTQDEMSSSLQKLADELDSQFHQMRMEQGGMGAMGGMPPPPPPAGEDEGYTADELSSMASEIGSTDSKMSGLMSSIAENFDEADANGDGRVTASEARAYDESQNTSATSATDGSSSSASSDSLVLKRIMELAASYGDSSFSSTASSLLSVTA